MRVVEDPCESEQVPEEEVFSYESGKPTIGEMFEANHRMHRTCQDGVVRESKNGTVLTLGRYFYLVSGHCVGQTTYRCGKVVFRCTHCGTYRTVTTKCGAKAKFYILGWFMEHSCKA